MIKNYLLTAWRNLVKNRVTALINIAGLSVAFTCCILLFLLVHYEFSIDGFQREGRRLFLAYSLTHKQDGEQKGQSMPYPAASALKAHASCVVASTAFMQAGGGVRYKGKELDKDIRLVDPDFFKMFSFPIVVGNAASPLGELNSVVLSESTAAAVFGSEPAVGKTVGVKISGVWKDLRVSAVIGDVPGNSSLRYDVLARIELGPDYAVNSNNWNWQHHPVFVELAPGAARSIAEKDMRRMVKTLRLADDDFMRKQQYTKDENGDYYSLRLLPLPDLHFDDQVGMYNTVNKTYLYTLSLIAVVILVIACFNFVNLNVARSFTRAKEVGIRKTMGAGRRQIYFQLWAESGLLFVVALGISAIAASLLLHPFNELFTEKLRLSMLLDWRGVLFVTVAAVVVSFLAGGYPAWLVSRFNAVEVLKGKVSMRRDGFLRSLLITFQFVLASALISSTLVIYRQFEHLRNAPLGFEQESLISIPVKRAENARRYAEQLRLRLANQPQVLAVTASGTNIGIGEDGSQSWADFGFSYKGKVIMTRQITVDYDFLRTLGIKPLDGRDFSVDHPGDTAADVTAVIVTESMARQFGEKRLTGMTFLVDS